MTRARSNSAFTLLELVVVLTLVGVVLGMAAPSLRGWSRGGKLQDAADGFVGATRWARSAAISTARVHRLQIDPEGGGYVIDVVEGDASAPAAGEFGRTVVLPPSIRIANASPTQAIEFFPSGRVTPGTVRISGDWGETIEITCAAPAESWRIASGGER
jgi:type II secretion system protein H